MIVKAIPQVSVILPVYNSGEFINDAVQSILDQTYPNFELIIINDCSTDNSEEILNGFTDSRIRLFKNEVNLRVVKTLNKGISLSRGKYIARMDADDICHYKRLEKQAAFLDSHPDIDICGTWVQTFGEENKIMRAATEHEHIKVRLFFINPIFHPSVMFRKKSLVDNNLLYDKKYTNAEDYGLWVQTIDTLKFANLPEILLKYRIHANNVSVFKESNKRVLDEIHFNVYAHFLNKLGLDYTHSDLLMHRKLGMGAVGPLTPAQLTEYLFWLKKLTIANNNTHYFNPGYFRSVMLSYILYLIRRTSPAMEALSQAYKVLGSLYNLNDYAGFIIGRTKVKLQPIKKF